jgi:DeoR/GlpR family transcriptional regulator of sugar metabolism
METVVDLHALRMHLQIADAQLVKQMASMYEVSEEEVRQQLDVLRKQNGLRRRRQDAKPPVG